jgi:serine protease
MKAGECGSGQPPQDFPSSWHGTHVAGTIGVGATDNGIGIAGINWEVKVQPLRVLGKCGGSTSDIADAIRWAAGLDVPGIPKNTTPAKVINMSLGGPRACTGDQVSQRAINDAVAAGTTVVVAAGNDNKDAAGFSPAGCDNVITVAASDPEGVLTTFSNWGPSVEILAPGGEHGRGCPKPEDGVLSMVARGGGRGACVVPDAYAYYNGTSMASPHVAGVVALMLARNGNLTPNQIPKILQDTAIARSASQCRNPCGKGLMDANAAVIAAGGLKPDGLSIAMPSSELELEPGQSRTTQAIVARGGTAVAGTTVNFSSSNTSIATVTRSAVTDASGQAQATVKASETQKGTVQIKAQANSKEATQPVRVPVLSRFGLIVLVACVVLISFLRREPKAARK